MKKALTLLLAALFLCLAGCGGGLRSKKKIVALYQKNEKTFLTAVETGDYAAVRELRGVEDVFVRDGGREIQFYCGGFGLVPSTSYWGVLWLKDAEAFAELAATSGEWSAEGAGWRYRQSGGDNDFYYEPLGNGFFYYEEHY